MGRVERRRRIDRDNLVRAARRLFSEHGLFDARVEDLAKHAGIAKGTVYLHFESREALALAVVGAGFEELSARVDARATVERSLEARIGAAIAAHLEFFAENQDLMRVFHQARGILKFGGPEWRPLRRPLERHLDRIAGSFEEVASARATALGIRQWRAIASDLFGAISGACSVRVALGASIRSARWGSILRSGLTTYTLELAAGYRPRRSGGGRR